MTRKLHLGATVPNEGARLLARALMRDPALHGALVHRGIDATMIDRLVAGELTPGLAIGSVIYAKSAHTIKAAHWNRPASGWWFDAPAQVAA